MTPCLRGERFSLYNLPFTMPETPKKTVGIVSKPHKPEVADIMPGLIQWMRAHNYDFIVDPETAPHAAGAMQISREGMASRQLKFIIVLGGDGTLLSAARAVAKA